ncbi:MAG: ABC-2 transporter permease [Cyanobacteria bacterium REEB65]|nr:ABC-2 transporter permease [Cyanobacteria bacterium REEB65]
MWSHIAAVFRKEWLHMRRDPLTLALIFFLPIVQLVMFGYAVNMDVKHLPAAVLNLDRGAYGRVLVDDLEQAQDANGDRRFSVAEDAATSEAGLRRLLVAGKIRMALVIPPNFTADVQAGQPASPRLLIDGSDATTARQALFFTRGMVLQHGIAWMKERMPSFLRLLAPGDRPPLSLDEDVLFNPDLKSANFFIPGLLGIIMMMLTVVLTALSIARERERGSLEQLVVTPIRPVELMLGKLLPYAIDAFLDFCMVMVLMVFLFGIPIAGNLPALLAFSLIFLFTCLALGLLISTIATFQAQAFLIALAFTMLPGMLLSGFMFPRTAMPAFLYDLGFAVPLTYFIEVLRGLILRGTHAADLMSDILPLAALGLALTIASTRRFRKTLA